MRIASPAVNHRSVAASLLRNLITAGASAHGGADGRVIEYGCYSPCSNEIVLLERDSPLANCYYVQRATVSTRCFRAGTTSVVRCPPSPGLLPPTAEGGKMSVNPPCTSAVCGHWTDPVADFDPREIFGFVDRPQKNNDSQRICSRES